MLNTDENNAEDILTRGGVREKDIGDILNYTMGLILSEKGKEEID